jgi:rRNA-processing protein FCF1
VCGRGVEPLMLAGTASVAHADHVSRGTMVRMQLAIMATADKELKTWCEESGVPVISDTTGASLASALLESRS